MAATPVTPVPVGAWPTAPQRTDAPAVFVTRADAWVSATPTRSSEMNALATNVNGNATSALDSAAEAVVSASAASVSAALSLSSAQIAAAVAGYGGAWASLTGAAAVPLSVAHDGAFWILLTSVADVAAEEPGTSLAWLRAYGFGNIETRTSNVEFTAQNSGTIFKYASGTFDQTFALAATLGPNWIAYVINAGAGVITLNPAGAETIDGAATKIVKKDTVTMIFCNGVNFTTIETLTSSAVGDSRVEVNSGNGLGSTNTCIRRYSTVKRNVGTAITYADSEALGATFTINEDGLYAIRVSDLLGIDIIEFGASLNSTQLTTTIGAITDADVLLVGYTPAGSLYSPISGVFRLVAGDVVRSHTQIQANGTSAKSTLFSITKVAI